MSNSKDLSNSPIPVTFESIRRTDPDGQDFWSARDLMPVLEYTKWQNFKTALNKAKIACQNSGYDPDDHFIQAVKMVSIGSDAKREVEDLHLSRYACYLIIQNADPSKEVIALGQSYFAIQARRQEMADKNSQLSEDQQRLLLRQQMKQQNKDLTSAARRAGVITGSDFATFQNHGYQGLYNGLTNQDIKAKRNLKKSQNILDHMSATELAANLFRSTQAEEKLRRDRIQGKDAANEVHYQAGKVVRKAIQELGGTMPEDLPAVDSIKKLERAEKKRFNPSKSKPKKQGDDA